MKTTYIVAFVSIILIITFFILSRKSSSIDCTYTPTPSSTSFSPCSAKECGTTGNQTRPKYLIVSQPSNGGQCTQKDIMETTPCSAVPCSVDFKYTPSNGAEYIKKDIRDTNPVDCTYTPSNASFTPCSAKECGTTGNQTRPKYMIVSPSMYGGKCTQKDIMEFTPCSVVPCAVDCTYTPSNASFSPCNAKECRTTGTQSRHKYKIISPSMYGGNCTQENEYDIVTCRSLSCPTLYDNYVNNINFIRTLSFDLPGAGWTEYFGKNPVPLQSMRYISSGIITSTNKEIIAEVNSNILKFKLDEYRADPIQWAKIFFYDDVEKFWYILSGCLSEFMKTLDKQYINLFMRITTDYFKNNKEAVKGVDKKQYSDNAEWLLSMSSSIITILNELGGFLKFIGKERMSTSKVDSIWQSGSTYFYTNEPPLDNNQIRQLLSESFSPEVYSNIRKGMLVDNSKELIMYYKYRGKVPNQRLEGLTALLMMSHMFKNYCDDDVTDYNYEYTITDKDTNNIYTKRITRLSDIVLNINSEAIEGISLYLREQFWDDGPMLESSLNYNMGVVRKLIEVKRYVGESNINSIDKIISKFNDFLDGITTQNNILPPIGNVPQQGLSRVPGVVYTKSVYYPLSGFSVLRNKDLYLFMNYGILTRGHKINSSYSIVLSAFNKMLFTMGGPGTYGMVSETSPLRPVSSFFSENCSFKSCSWVVDNLNRSSIYYNNQWQSLVGINPTTNILLGTRFGLSDDFDVVQHSMDVEYGLLFGTSLKTTTTKVRVNFSRCIVLSKSDNVFYIIDKITPSDNMKHTYTHPWIFNIDFLQENVTLMKDGFYTTQPNSVNVQVKYYNNTVLTHNLYYNQLDSTIPVKTSNSSFVNSNLGPLGYTSTGIATIKPSVNILSMSDSITGPMISIAQIAPYNSTTPPSTFNSVCKVDEISGIVVKSSSSQVKLGWNTSSIDGFYGINNVKISDIISR